MEQPRCILCDRLMIVGTSDLATPDDADIICLPCKVLAPAEREVLRLQAVTRLLHDPKGAR